MSRILSYVIGAMVSAVLHVGVIVALWANWQPSSETVYLQPKYVVAELVQLAPRAPAVSKEKKTSATSDQLARKKKRQLEERKRKSRADELRKNAKKAALAARKKREDEERLALEKRRLEESRRVEREQQQAEWEDMLTQKEAQMDAQEDQRAANSYRQIIQQRLSENWSRPPSARRNMEAQVRIQLVPTGRVVGVNIIKSSGDAAFDRSVEQAVRKAHQFIELQAMDSRLFELKFRSVDVAFSPEDLRL
ncbi:MAG: TonB family protein [Cellvibrionales bacterium]|nr:cell envelope integrity protein TolA [Porticoccaceae bacterium]|tara:strand:- start:1998 stop:2747 length:750 start_codon:yes stop_codon:yes gene_type:complete